MQVHAEAGLLVLIHDVYRGQEANHFPAKRYVCGFKVRSSQPLYHFSCLTFILALWLSRNPSVGDERYVVDAHCEVGDLFNINKLIN